MTAGRRAPGPAVAAAAIAVATAIVAIGLSLGTDRAGEAAPTPTTERQVPARVPDSLWQLASGLPDGAEPVAGGWDVDADGATVVAPAAAGSDPLLTFPLADAPWATATISGVALDGWSVAFAVEGPGSYWAATVRPGSAVELVRVRGGQPTVVGTLPIGPDAPTEVEVAWRGRHVQVAAAGVPLPTVTASAAAAATPTLGLVGRGAAAAPGAARWTGIGVQGVDPLAPALLPPALAARHTTADEVRAALHR